MMKKTAVITGGSSGIGKAAAQAFAKGGYQVYELSRRGKHSGDIRHITADVTKEEEVILAFKQVYEEQGQIDLVIISAGFGISGATEFTSLNAAKALFDVNFFGMAAAINAAMPYLRKSRGRVISVSSVAGVLPVPFQSYYSASKAAMNALSECMRNEGRMFGISFCCMLPGDVQTAFTAARQKEVVGDDLYQGKITRSVAAMEKDEQGGMTAAYVGEALYRVAERKRVRPFYTVGKKYIFLSFIARLLPRRLVNWIMGRMYGG